MNSKLADHCGDENHETHDQDEQQAGRPLRAAQQPQIMARSNRDGRQNGGEQG